MIKPENTMSEVEMRELDAWLAEYVMGYTNGSGMNVDARYDSSFKNPVFVVHTRTIRKKFGTYVMLHKRGQGSQFHPTENPEACAIIRQWCLKECAPGELRVSTADKDGSSWMVRSCNSPVMAAGRTEELAWCVFAYELHHFIHK